MRRLEHERLSLVGGGDAGRRLGSVGGGDKHASVGDPAPGRRVNREERPGRNEIECRDARPVWLVEGRVPIRQSEYGEDQDGAERPVRREAPSTLLEPSEPRFTAEGDERHRERVERGERVE